MAKSVNPAERNRVAEEHGNFEGSSTGAGEAEFGGNVNNEWLIVVGILAFMFFN